jgi:hypothetical protein
MGGILIMGRWSALKNNKLVWVLVGIIGFQLGFIIGKFMMVGTNIRDLAGRVGKLEKEIHRNHEELESIQRQLNQRMEAIDEIIREVRAVKGHIRKSGKISEPRVKSLAYHFLWNVWHSDLELKLVLAAMTQESSCNPAAVGALGERGPLQVTYRTFLQYGRGSFYDWRDTMAAGFRFMSALSKKAGGNKELILAYYNAGPNRTPAEALRLAGTHIKRVMAYYHQIEL